jgi:hypothetical protein
MLLGAFLWRTVLLLWRRNMNVFGFPQGAAVLI